MEVIATVVGVILAFLGGRRISKLKAQALEVQIFENVKKLYLEAQETQKAEVLDLRKTIIDVQFALSAAVKKSDVYEKKYNVLAKSYARLKKDFEQLKRNKNGN